MNAYNCVHWKQPNYKHEGHLQTCIDAENFVIVQMVAPGKNLWTKF